MIQTTERQIPARNPSIDIMYYDDTPTDTPTGTPTDAQTDEIDDAFGPDIPNTEDIDSEEIKWQGQLIEPTISKNLLTAIEDAPLTRSCKNAFRDIVRTYFSRDTYLANIERPELAAINLEIDLATVPIVAITHDTMQGEFLRLKMLISQGFEIILTRARGPNRERLLQNLKRIEMRSGKASEIDPRTPHPRPKRRSLYGRDT